jgi:hypothetical protein
MNKFSDYFKELRAKWEAQKKTEQCFWRSWSWQDDVKTEFSGPGVLHQKSHLFSQEKSGPRAGRSNIREKPTFRIVDSFLHTCSPSYTSFPAHCLSPACSLEPGIKQMFSTDLLKEQGLEKGSCLSDLSHMSYVARARGKIENSDSQPWIHLEPLREF